MTVAEINTIGEAVDNAITEANAKAKACSDFVLKESVNIRDVPFVEGEPASTIRDDLSKLMTRMTEAKKLIAITQQSALTTRATRLKNATAKEDFEKGMACFKKYDADKDGKLSRKEIIAYAKGEFSFTIPLPSMDLICNVLIQPETKGVPLEEFQSVKVAVGLAREKVRDLQRREEREAKEREIQKKKEESAAKKQREVELEDLRKVVIGMIKTTQAELKLDNKGMVQAMAPANGDTRIGETELVKFVRECEKTQAALIAAKGENGVKEVKPIADGDLSGLFDYLDSEDDGFLSEEKFENMIRQFMKVVKPTILTEEIGMKSTSLRRIEADELMEVLQGPIVDESVEVGRMQVKALSDGVLGWLTPVGNQGTVYLEEGGNMFKVVKETILTNCFVIGTDKEETRKLKDNTRKVKVGEIVECCEWARTEPNSGLQRMKVRVKTDDTIGWATSVGNTGIVFLEVM